MAISLLNEREYRITDKVTVFIPTLGEYRDKTKRSDYEILMNLFLLTPSNYMLELRLRLLMTRKEKEIIRIKHEKKQIRKKLAESRIHSIQKRYRKKPFIDYNFDYFDNSNLDDLPF